MAILHWNQIGGPHIAYHCWRGTRHPDNVLPLHELDYARLFWIDAGRGKLHVNEKVIPLRPRQMIFIRPGDYHRIEISRQDSLMITNLVFPAKTLHLLRKRYFRNSTRWFWSRDPLPTVLELDPLILAEMSHLSDALVMAPRQPFYIELFLMTLFHRIELPDTHSFPAHTPDWLLHACRKIVTPEYLAQGVQGFVKLAGRCHEHVTRVTQSCLGETPSEYVNRVRMRYAAHQLEMTERSIIDIALNCGFQDISHFYKLFRTTYKTTPRRYRVERHRLL